MSETLITNEEIEEIIEQNIGDDEILDVNKMLVKTKICFNKIMHVCHDRHEKEIDRLKKDNEKLKKAQSRFKTTLMKLCRCDSNGVNNLTMCEPCKYKESFNDSTSSSIGSENV